MRLESIPGNTRLATSPVRPSYRGSFRAATSARKVLREPGLLNPVQLRVRSLSRLGAIFAHARYFKAVPGHAKAMFPRYRIPQRDELLILKLDQLLALRAVQMIMLRIAIVMLVHRAPGDFKSPQQSCVNKLIQRTVNRGAAHMALLTLSRQLL
jgi:hypothetical protein